MQRKLDLYTRALYKQRSKYFKHVVFDQDTRRLHMHYLILTGKAVIENKVLVDKTGEGNNQTKASPVMYVKYPSVRYILPHCSINKCQTSSHITHSVMKYPLLTAVLFPSTGLTQWAHGKSHTFPPLPEGLLLYFLQKPFMQGWHQNILIHYCFKKILVHYGRLWEKNKNINMEWRGSQHAVSVESPRKCHMPPCTSHLPLCHHSLLLSSKRQVVDLVRKVAGSKMKLPTAGEGSFSVGQTFALSHWPHCVSAVTYHIAC